VKPWIFVTPIALVLIRVIAFIYNLPILHKVVKGRLGSSLGIKEEAIIYTICYKYA
jgi:hypothetical protein